jgi:DNA-binding transcriptional MocR family regulator
MVRAYHPGMSTPSLAFHIATHPESQDKLYKQVALRISELIEHGTLRPGERIPSVRELSEREEVSIATVMQAYRVLESRGLIEARPQSGYYVRARLWSPPPEPGKSEPTRSATRVSVNELVMEVLQATHAPGLVGFGAAMPSPQLLPTAQLHRTMASVARRHGMACNSCDIPPGNLNLRTQIARRAMESGCTLAPDEIVTTCGCQEALNLCLRAVARPGDTIAIESPTYYGILQIIETLGMKACEIPTFPREGLCLEELVKRLDGCRIKACVFSLNFSNPLGSCMPDRKKERLVRILAERGVPLIEDDLYGNLSHAPQRPKTAKAFDKQGLVLLCDSFTKTLAPGWRVGWTAPGRFKRQVEHLKFVSSIGTPTLPQMAIAEFLANGGYDHHLRRLRRFYAEQVPRVTQAITRYFPEGTKVTRPTGGYVLWVELPPRVDSLELFHKALAEKISLAPGPIFSPKRKFQNFIRLSCGAPWTEAMDQAVLKLGRIIARMT